LAGLGEGYGKNGFRHTKAPISLKCGEIALLRTNTYRISVGAKTNDLG